MYTLLIIMIYMAFISLGLPDSLLGSAWPVMYQTLNVPISYMGIVTMTISGGTIVSSLFSDFLTKKFSTPVVTVTSVFLTGIALFGFSHATEFWMLIVFSIPYGLGAGAIDAALNNYVALHYTSKHMSWLHCFWGVGTIISPFVMSYSLANALWSDGYRIISVLQLCIGCLLLITLPVWKVNKTSAESADTKKDNADRQSISIASALKIKGVPFLLLGFLAYCSAESTAMGWVATYLVKVIGMTEERAAGFASFVFIGITLGRFMGGFLMERLGDRKMIILGAFTTILGIILLGIPFSDERFSLAGFFIIGLGFAPIYPCIIHSTPHNFGAENSGAIIGIQMASAYMGSTFLPPLFGLLGKAFGFHLLPCYLLFFIVLTVVMTEKTFRLTKT